MLKCIAFFGLLDILFIEITFSKLYIISIYIRYAFVLHVAINPINFT